MSKNNNLEIKNIDVNLLKRMATDRRLNAIDTRILLYFIGMNTEKIAGKMDGEEFFYIGRQEDIADMLNVTRENVNRAIHKLFSFGYLRPVASECIGLYPKQIYNVDTGELEVLMRKFRGNNRYIVNNNIKTEFTIRDFMELINVDVKNSKDKLLIEDKCKIEGCIYMHEETLEVKEELTQEEIKSKKFRMIDKVKISERTSGPEVEQLIATFESEFEYPIYEYNRLKIDGIILLVGAIEKFKNRCSYRVYNSILAFKERYLDNMIYYYMRKDILDESTLRVYHHMNSDIIKDRKINKNHLMKLLDVRNRDTTQTRNRFRFTLESLCEADCEFYTFLDALQIIKKFKKENLITDLIEDGLFNLPTDDLCEIYNI